MYSEKKFIIYIKYDIYVYIQNMLKYIFELFLMGMIISSI